MPVKSGLKEAQRAQVIKSAGGVRKIRCSCGGFAVAVPDGKGGQKFQCAGCKKGFVSTPM